MEKMKNQLFNKDTVSMINDTVKKSDFAQNFGDYLEKNVGEMENKDKK
jgi:hypothetical protein